MRTPLAYTARLACVRCGASVGEDLAFGGCRGCVAEGYGANVLPVYALTPGPLPSMSGEPGIFRFRELLPLLLSTPVISLEEGSTPLLSLPGTAESLGVGQLLLKDEARNPTWSFKDRLAAVAVSKALEAGADTVVVATTGNHGAAVAAYAAAAGLRCVALTLESVPLTMKVLMQVYGASVVALHTGPERWTLMAQAVAERGWVPMSGFQDPPVGSNPFGIDGYKTIAYELYGQLGEAVPDVVVVPTAYGDGLVGVWRGFTDLLALGLTDRVPRMVAAEPYGPYAAALETGADRPGPLALRGEASVAFSTATPVGTQQGLLALRASGGAAVAVDDDGAILAAQKELARRTGLYLEAASALVLPALARLVARRVVGPTDTVVMLGTSSGLKDVGATAAALPPVELIGPTLGELDRALAVGAC